MTTKRARTTGAMLAATILLTIGAVGPGFAGDHPHDRKGLFLGGNVGWASASYSTKVGDSTISDKPFGGGAGALRIGYAFSNSFALSLEGHGFGTEQGGHDWGMGAGFLTVTWWPDGSGFFLRLGGGSGGGQALVRDSGELIEFREKAAGLFGLGYEWRLGDKFALGVAADGYGFDLNHDNGDIEDFVGIGTFSIQFNWYL